MRRRRLLAPVLLVAMCMVIAACGGGEDSESTTTEATTPEPTAAPETTAPPETTPETTAPPTDEIVGTIKIGAALSETGKFAVEGKDSRQGYDTWKEWVNNVYGGIRLPDGRYEAEIIYYDDESDADTAANLTERLISEDEVAFMLGPYSSSLTTGASAISEAANIIMIEGNGVSDAMFERGFKNLFLVATIGSDYTKSGIEAFAAAGAKTAVVAYEDTSFPTSVAEGALRHLEDNGIEVLATETYPKDPTDLTPIISQFRELEPDIFIGGGHYIDAVMFLNASEDTGFAPKGMMITVGPSNPKLIDEVKGLADGVVGPTQWEATMAYSGDWLGSAADYAAYYENLWGEPPVYQAASATASALALHIAVEQAGTIETDAVREALLGMNVNTFYGPISFDERGVNTSKPMGAIQVQEGEINVVAPDDAAVAQLEYPR